MYRVNVGCGMSPTEGWINFDNSLSVKISKFPRVTVFLHRIGMIGRSQLEYIRFCKKNTIQWAHATKHLPLPDSSAEVLYSSHMLEHLDREEVIAFLGEARRVLAIGGIIRIAVPDLEKYVEAYLKTRDADAFIESTHLCSPRPRRFADRMRLAVVGHRHHQWMYDGASLCRVLIGTGFHEVQPCEAGVSRIPNPAPLNLREREEESVYIEAIRA